MKKIWLGMLMFSLIFVGLTGCGNSEVSIDNGSIDKSTVAVNKDGTVQMGLVKEFSKDYYNLDELKKFVNKNVTEFVSKQGKDSVVLDYLDVKDKNAYVTLSFPDMEKYSAFNSEKATFMTLKEAKAANILPESLQPAEKDKATVSPGLISDEDGYYVVKMKKSYQLMVEGDIYYYADGILLNSNTIQTSDDKETVVVFK